jgi:uncharacterized repeat protein (TIGR03803 family)
MNTKTTLLALCALLIYHFNLHAQPQLWGTTNSGGSILAGTIFHLDTAGNNYNLIYDWQNLNDGKKPHTGLLQASNEKLYGVTYQDGPFFGGVLFEYDYVTNTYTHKHDFQDPSGSLPIGPVIQSTNGKLYGMTSFGGANNFGVIYSYDLGTNQYTNHVDFDNISLGSGPHGRLLEAPNGKMYGLTGHGGTLGFGTIIEFDPATNLCITALNLDSIITGLHSEGSFVLAPNGKLYAMSSFGGSANKGVLFEYDYTTNTVNKLVDFLGPNGAYAYSDVFVASNGKLYGMTYEGGVNNDGVIFEYDLTTSTFTVKYNFDGGSNGANPKGSFMESSNGKLYAYNSFGGAFNKGVVIEYDFVNDIVTKKLDFDGVNGSFNSQNFFIEVCAKPTIEITASQDTLCEGDSLLLDAFGTGSSYTWSAGVTDSTWFKPNVGTNIFNVSSTNSCGTSSLNYNIIVNPTFITYINDSICYGDSYTFPTSTVNNITSNIIDSAYFLSVNGCDSTIVTNLFVKPTYFIQDTVFVCDGNSHTFPDGTTQVISNDLTYMSNLQTTLLCDSIIQTNVLMAQTYSLKDSVFICMGNDHTFHDGITITNITNDTIHQSILTSAYGCDSLITTTAIVVPVYSMITDSINVCSGDNYFYPDGFLETNITANTSHMSNLQTSYGCDSIINTIITVNPLFQIAEAVDVCYGTNYMFADSVVYSAIINDTSHISVIDGGFNCDTLLTTSLVVHPIYDLISYDTICKGANYTFPDGFIVTNIQGSLSHQSQFNSTYGCDSLLTTNLYVGNIDTSITKIGNLLIANSTANVTYQWYDCLNNTILSNDTSQSFLPSISGSYAVIISDNYCSDTSSCYQMDVIGFKELIINQDFSVFPNPFSEKINIVFNLDVEQVDVTIYSLQGDYAKSFKFEANSEIVIETSDLNAGVYIVKIQSNNSLNYVKLISNGNP